MKLLITLVFLIKYTNAQFETQIFSRKLVPDQFLKLYKIVSRHEIINESSFCGFLAMQKIFEIYSYNESHCLFYQNSPFFKSILASKMDSEANQTQHSDLFCI